MAPATAKQPTSPKQATPKQPTGLSRVAKPTLADLVYQQLLDGIVAGQIQSGAYLNVPDIAKEMGVSPTPVRDAMVRLATEGLVTTNTGNRRAVVIGFAQPEIEQLFDLREVLEGAAAERAARRITPDELARVRDLAGRTAALSNQSEQKKLMLDLDQQFHLSIADACGNLALRDEIARTSSRIRIIQWLRLDYRRMPGATSEHQEIVEALAAHDAAAARTAMSRHVRNSLQRLLSGLPGAAAQ